jgi:hypothetical protein
VSCILEEFSHRPWQREVQCEWRTSLLRLTATNESDPNGLALLDEFWDAVHICVSYDNPIRVQVESVS